ncbi:MAG: hypothetical protein HYV07_06895 [Deltaproteobacteria bacterium]|nr:hypothetical protein [Deltaproteobacteria bacterium]
MNSETRTAVEAAINKTFVELLLKHRDVSMNDILGVVASLGTAAKPAAPELVAAAVAPAKTQTPKKSATSLPKKVAAPLALPDLRSQSGRDAYDAMIMAALVKLGGANISAREIGAQVPGSDEHRRNSLHRLMKQGSVTTTGQKAATKYSIVAQVASAAEK